MTVDVRVRHQPCGSDFGLEEIQAIAQTLQQEAQTEGPQNRAFEQEFARLCGVPHAFTMANCSVALLVAGQLCGLRPGDEVITTPLTFVSTSTSVLACGATPVFADVDPRTFNIDPAAVAAAVTPRTRAIYVVHLFGQCCDVDAVTAIARRHGLRVVEDAAHVAGAAYRGRPAGSLGDAAAFSFHSRKNITTLGEGGMLTTRDAAWAAKVPLLRSIGVDYSIEHPASDYWLPLPYDVEAPDGYIPTNYRMSEAQAAVGRVQLRKLAAMNSRRRAIARRYTEALAGVPGLVLPFEDPAGEHIYYLYSLLVDEAEAGFTRDDLMRTLFREFGVQTITGYPPAYWFSVYRTRGYARGLCPVAEHVYNRILMLPVYARLTDAEIDYVIDSVTGAVRRLRG
jgi:dTDP-4-amino-4,6-dideoxygalactose transaminase